MVDLNFEGGFQKILELELLKTTRGKLYWHMDSVLGVYLKSKEYDSVEEAVEALKNNTIVWEASYSS